MIFEIVTSVLIVAGSLFVLLAAIGLIRFPDVFIRMAAVSKAATLGMVLILVGVAFQQTDFESVLKLAFIAAFTFITGPAASHLIGRAAYHSGAPLFPQTQRDDWKSELKNEEGEGQPQA